MHPFSDEEKELVETFNSNQKENINIKFIESGSKEDKILENFLTLFARSAQHVTIKKEKREENHLPEIIVTENIRYSAVPLSNELKPFLKALSQNTHTRKREFSQKIKTNLKKIDIPIKLKLFVAPECPHCPILVENMIDMAYECKNIELNIIDPTIFTEEATANSIMSVPCLVLDDDFRWTGSVTMEEITDVLANRDSSTLKASNLRRILEDGKASWLTEQMLVKNMIFPEFIKLVIHEIWSVRLGAIVVIEELAEKNIELANKICPLLWDKFHTVSVDVKGDIFYALGEAGRIEDMVLIEKELKNIDSTDLQEAANDSLEAIKLRI
ncbi:MAG: thioredoxin family protein [Desulfobacterales bacterium]|nr:thioredoxin family protein [Desulfobacterales bacterium]